MIKFKDVEWCRQSWAYKLGWLHYMHQERQIWFGMSVRHQHEYDANRFPYGSTKHNDYMHGWNDADFANKVESGYYDWDRTE